MPDPILYDYLVGRLTPGASGHDDQVANTGAATGPQRERRASQSWPGSRNDRRNQQDRGKVNERRLTKCPDGLAFILLYWTPASDVAHKRNHHELKARQRSRRRTQDDVEVFPGSEWRPVRHHRPR